MLRHLHKLTDRSQPGNGQITSDAIAHKRFLALNDLSLLIFIILNVTNLATMDLAVYSVVGAFPPLNANSQSLLSGRSQLLRSIINGHGRLHVPPFTSNVLSLTRCFTLLHVTMNSLAPNFTITRQLLLHCSTSCIHASYGFICKP